jgi:hypothetical protein
MNEASLSNLVINESLINFFAPNVKNMDQEVMKKNIYLVYQYSEQILA